jgi:hypothetical protein
MNPIFSTISVMVNYPVIYLIKVLSIMEYVPELGSDYLHPILT